MYLDSHCSTLLFQAATREKRTRSPHAIQMRMRISPEKIVDPPTPRKDFSPNIAAVRAPREEREVHALAKMMNRTYTGMRKRKPAMATFRMFLRKLLIGATLPAGLQAGNQVNSVLDATEVTRVVLRLPFQFRISV